MTLKNNYWKQTYHQNYVNKELVSIRINGNHNITSKSYFEYFCALLLKTMSTAEKVVDKMFESDWFSRWLGIERLVVEKGHCKLKMQVRKDMLNGFGTLHGGITFSLADSALAFASNAHGRLSVALEASISFPLKAVEGDILIAEAVEQNLSNRTGIYYITVTNQRQEKIGLFRGTVYRTDKKWFEEDV